MTKLFAFIVFISVTTTIYAAKPTQNTLPILTQKEANALTISSLERSYNDNKQSCDKALTYANIKIQEASNKLTFTATLYISFIDGYASDVSTTCPKETFYYLIRKSGYDIKLDEHYHEVIFW
jgi:hypothetical protein